MTDVGTFDQCRFVECFPLGMYGQTTYDLQMPAGAKVLRVGKKQDGDDNIYLWAEIDTRNVPTKRTFYSVMTGVAMPRAAWTYIGSVQFPYALLHIYESI